MDNLLLKFTNQVDFIGKRPLTLAFLIVSITKHNRQLTCAFETACTIMNCLLLLLPKVGR